MPLSLLGGYIKVMNKAMTEFNLTQRTKEIPELRSGDVVKVFRKIIEGGKERIQMFEGIIIAIKGGQSSSQTITVRKVSNGIGVELVLPLHSPIIDRIEVVKRAKVRRSKLYFMRDRSLKSLKLRYKALADFIKPDAKKVEKAPVVEEKVETVVEEVKEIEEVKEEKSE
jgi:large subunit ribosomal protein L19